MTQTVIQIHVLNEYVRFPTDGAHGTEHVPPKRACQTHPRRHD